MQFNIKNSNHKWARGWTIYHWNYTHKKGDIISTPLSIIINQSLYSDSFPSKLKLVNFNCVNNNDNNLESQRRWKLLLRRHIQLVPIVTLHHALEHTNCELVCSKNLCKWCIHHLLHLVWNTSCSTFPSSYIHMAIKFSEIPFHQITKFLDNCSLGTIFYYHFPWITRTDYRLTRYHCL